MGFGWRRKGRTSPGPNNKKKQDGSSSAAMDELVMIPKDFLCPISLDLMRDPVTISSGVTYDRESIEAWLQDGNFTCPVTNLVLTSFDVIPNHTLRKMIQDWCVENRNRGIDRIPTPRVPVTPIQVSEVLFSVTASAKRLDQCGCLDSLQKIKRWGVESERNRSCIVVNGAAGVLAAAFDAFAAVAAADSPSVERNVNVLQEILSLMNWMFPLDAEAQKYLGSASSLRCMIRFLKCEDLSAKQNSLIVLKELLFSDPRHAESLAAVEGGVLNEVLFNLVEKNICPTLTKTSLMVIFGLVSSPSSQLTIVSEFVKMGLVSLLLEFMIDAERGATERALGILDSLCDSEEGRKEAHGNALTGPVLVKKILRASELATKYSVSVLWKLSRSSYERGEHGADQEEIRDDIIVEALQVGAFQKLVLILQLGCDHDTKEKATELLKMMNPYRVGLECIESADFKNLKRSF